MQSTNTLSLADQLARGGVNFASDTFKFLLVATAPTQANMDTWTNRSEVTGEVAAQGGYTAGGASVTLTIGSKDSGQRRVPVTVSNLTNAWPNATISAVGGFVYKSTGSASNDRLVSYVDFGGTVSSTNANFAVNFTSPLFIQA